MGKSKIELVKMDINNEAHFLRNIEKTPSFIIYHRSAENFWGVDLMLGQPLSKDEGYPDFDQMEEGEQVRAILCHRVSDFIKRLDKWPW